MKPKFFLSCFFLFIFSFQVSFPVIAAYTFLNQDNKTLSEEFDEDDNNFHIQESAILAGAFDLLAESKEKEKSGEEKNLDFLISFHLVRVLYSVLSPIIESSATEQNIAHRLEGLPAFIANRVLRI